MIACMFVCICYQEFTSKFVGAHCSGPAAFTDLFSKEGRLQTVTIHERIFECKDMLQRLSESGVNCQNFPAETSACRTPAWLPNCP